MSDPGIGLVVRVRQICACFGASKPRVDQASIMAIVLYKVVTASRNKQLLRKLTRGSLSVVSKNRQPSVSDIDEGPTQLLISLKISV